MFKLRGCPKCHGDLFIGEDIYGAYLNCVQCGGNFPVEAEPARDEGVEAAVLAAGPPGEAELVLVA